MQKTLGGQIRAYRKRTGMSQFDLELEIDASPGSVSRIENGLVNPTKETIKKIVKALSLSSIEESDLFGIDYQSILRDEIFPGIDDNYKKLYYQGKFRELDHQLLETSSFQKLDNQKLLFFAKIKDKLGEIDYVSSAIDELDARIAKKKDLPTFVRSTLLKSRMYNNRGKAEKAIDLLENSEKQILALQNRGYIGEFYFELGKMYLFRNNLSTAERYLFMSLNYYDVKNYTHSVVAVYLWLAKIALYEIQTNLACKYLTMVKELISLVESRYLRAWYENTLGEYYTMTDDIVNAQKHAHIALKIHSQLSASPINLSYDYRISGMIEYKKENWTKAYHFVKKSELQENILKGRSSITKSYLLKLFIESRFDYEKSIINLRQDVEQMSEENPQRDIGIFLLNCACLFHSEENKEKKKAYTKLKNLESKTKSSFIKNALKLTLKRNQICVIL